MATILPTESETPVGPLLGPAIIQFLVTAASLVAVEPEGADGELAWLRGAWRLAAPQIAARAAPRIDDEDWELPLAVLLLEMAYVCIKFRTLTEEIWPEGQAPFTDASDAQLMIAAMAAVRPETTPNFANMQTAEAVLDSIDKLIESLPRWARKIIHTLREALQILRFATGG